MDVTESGPIPSRMIQANGTSTATVNASKLKTSDSMTCRINGPFLHPHTRLTVHF